MTIGYHIIVEVNVRGVKQRSTYKPLLRCLEIGVYTYAYVDKRDRTYKYRNGDLTSIYQQRYGKKHGYRCRVVSILGTNLISSIAQYENGKLVKGSEGSTYKNRLRGSYNDASGKLIYEEGYLSEWLDDGP
jgi:hypothetical protein